MIYIVAPDTLPVMVPRTAAVESLADPALRLINTTDKTEYDIPVLSIEVVGDYFAISADFSALKVQGEYEYLLTLGGQNTASGVAIAGGYHDPEPQQTEIGIEFTQYDENE